jgi:hypothetical protein
MMPILKENGVTSILFGAGDVGLAVIEDQNLPISFLAISQMNKTFEINGDVQPGIEDVFANQPEIVLGFYNLQGIDNIISILQRIRNSIEKREQQIRTEAPAHEQS